MDSYRAADGAELFFDDAGPHGGIPLLFVHGWQADATIWAPVRAGLAAFRTIAVDLRGAGASNAAPRPFTIDQFASDLTDLVAALDLDPLVVVGHSMGAKVALRFAIDRPEAVEGLVLVAPVPPGAVAYPPPLDAFLRGTIGNPERAAAWLARLTASELPPETRRALARAHAGNAPHAALEAYASWTTLDFEDDARTIATPTLVLAPSDDKPATPAFVRERVADVVPASRMTVVERSGHYLPLEQPEALARAIAAFAWDL